MVAALVRGMRVEDALLQLQLTIKRAAKTVYQVTDLSSMVLPEFEVISISCLHFA